MAHTILRADGFEHDAMTLRYSSSERVGSTPTTTNTNPMFGYGRSMVISGDDGNYFMPLLSGSPYTVLFVSLHHRTSNNSTTETALITFYDYLNNAPQLTVTIQYVSGDGNHTLRVRRGSKTGTVLATAAGALPASGTWAHISVMAKVGNPDGIVKVLVDSTNVVDFTGNTQNNATARIDRVQFHGKALSQSNVYDNLVIASGLESDSPLPEVRIYTQFPNANDSVQFSVFGSASQWSAVNEVPPNGDSSYTYSSTVGHQDTFTHAAPSIGSTVLAVQVSQGGRMDDANHRLTRSVIKPASAVYQSPLDQKIPNTYQINSGIWQTNPETALMWTPSEAMGAKFGYRISG